MGVAAGGTRAQNQTIGKEFQGTTFTPALEDTSHTRGSALLATLILESSFDTNLLQSQSGVQLEGPYQVIEGEVTYDVRRPGDDLLLRYWGGVRIYPGHANLNSVLQDARLQWTHRIGSRLEFVATSRYAYLPGGVVLENNPGQGFPLLVSGSSAYSFLQQKLSNIEGTIGATGRLSRHTFAVFGTNFLDSKHYGTDLIDTKELDAYAGVYYVPTHSQSLGAIYSQQWMKFGLGFGNSEVKSLFLTYSLGITPTISISAFAGPSRIQQLPSTINSPGGNPPGVPPELQVVPQSMESGILGGVKVERHYRHNILRLSYTRLITNGGGYLSSVLQEMAELSASRSLRPHLEVSLGGTYTQNTQIGLSNLNFKTFYIEPSLTYQWTRNLKLTLRSSYGKIAGLEGSAPIKREEVALRLEYVLPQISIGK